jgi:xylulokinase
MPHTEPDCFLAGGPSNAGGLFINWALRTLGAEDPAGPARPDHVPVWAPYPRGERVPLHDAHRRGALVDLDLTHDAASVRRAAFESSAFIARRIIEASPVRAQRIVATGGGTRVPHWMSSLADCTGLPVHVCGVPEGGALGAAFLARLAAGFEKSTARASEWAVTARVVDPDPRWVEPANERFARFCEVAG